MPNLVLHGSDDPMFPLAHGERLNEVLPAASLQTFAGRGHGLDVHPMLPAPLVRRLSLAAAT